MSNLDRPSQFEHQQLLFSAELRDQRRQEHLAQLALGPEITNRGRKGVDELLQDLDGGLFPPQEVIPEEIIIDYAKRKQAEFPLFNQFNDHAHIDPTKDSIERYCMGGNDAFYRSRLNKERSGKTPGPLDKSDRQALQRQTQHLADRLQATLMIDMNTARLHRTSLDTVRRQIRRKDDLLDSTASVYAINAIGDFGLSVLENGYKDKQPNDIEFGLEIIKFHSLVIDNSGLLAKNPLLLKLVQLDQKAHQEYWTERLEAAKIFLGDRLTADDNQAATTINQELSRQREI